MAMAGGKHSLSLDNPYGFAVATELLEMAHALVNVPQPGYASRQVICLPACLLCQADDWQQS